MKPLLYTLATAALLLVGCEPADDTATLETTDAGGEEAKPVLAISIPSADHGWTGGVVYWANKAKEDFGDRVDVRVQTADGPDQQINQIETLLAGGVDGMVVLATESQPLTNTAKKVAERGVYLVNVDRGFEEPVADVYLAGDNAAFGRKSAEFVAEKMGGQGNLVVLTGIPSTVDTARVEAAMEVFAQHPDINILDQQAGEWNRDKSLTVMQALLQKHSQIDAVWAQDDDMAEGVEQAVREAGREGELWILGGAGKKEIVKRVMDGDALYPATITYPPAMIYAGAAVAAAELTGGDLADAADQMPEHLGVTREMLEAAAEGEGQKQVTLDVFLVTPDNASEYYFPESIY